MTIPIKYSYCVPCRSPGSDDEEIGRAKKRVVKEAFGDSDSDSESKKERREGSGSPKPKKLKKVKRTRINSEGEEEEEEVEVTDDEAMATAGSRCGH